MKLRERIAEAVYRKSRGADDWLSGEEPYPGYKESYRDHYRGIADEVIAIVRETLLSEDGIRWAASASADTMADMVEAHDRYVPLGEAVDEPLLMAVGEAALLTAFTAAFGADDDGGES